VVDVPNLRTLILGPGRLSLDVVNACLGFNRLKHLELVDAAPTVDYQLLKDIGGLGDLTTFVIDAQTVPYAPSDPIALADAEQERSRIKEAERQQSEEVERRRAEEKRRRQAEEDEDSEEESDPPCVRLGKKKKRHCSCCRTAIISAITMCSNCASAHKAQETKLKQEVQRQQKPEVESRPLGIIEAGPPQEDAPIELQPDESQVVSVIGVVLVDSHEELLCHNMFPKLSSLTVRGSAELVQDIIQLVSSTSITLLCLELAQSPRKMLPSVPPPQRFLATVDSALHRWASTLAHVVAHSSMPGAASEIPDETLGALMRLPRLEHLEISGWKIASNITETICRHTDTNPSKLKVFHLPNDSNAISIPLSDLRPIAEACPNLQSLRCRLKDLTDISNQPVSVPLAHSLENLTVGDTQPPLECDVVLGVARYIDNLFPRMKGVRPLEDVAQNADQWRWIDKLVKLRQSARLDDKNRPLA